MHGRVERPRLAAPPSGILASLSVKIFMQLDGKSSFNLKIPPSPPAFSIHTLLVKSYLSQLLLAGTCENVRQRSGRYKNER